jgi:hypothetical protein
MNRHVQTVALLLRHPGCRASVLVLALGQVSGYALALEGRGGHAATAAEGVPTSPRPAVGDDDLERVRIRPDGLIRVGETTRGEDRALAQALRNWSARGVEEDLSGLWRFLDAHPRSAWAPSLLVEMSVVYRQTGHFQRAATAAERAWRMTRRHTDHRGRTLADRALEQQLTLATTFGSLSTLRRLVRSAEGRSLAQPAEEALQSARQRLIEHDNPAQRSPDCGTLALARLMAFENAPQRAAAALPAETPYEESTTLAEIVGLSQRLGWPVQAVRAAEGSEPPVPSIVHFRQGHFAALLRREGGRFLVADVLRGDVWMTAAALREETSGYFAVRDPRPQAAWTAVPQQVAASIRGAGRASKVEPGATADCDHIVNLPCGGKLCRFMAGYGFHTMLASLHIVDTPLVYCSARQLMLA